MSVCYASLNRNERNGGESVARSVPDDGMNTDALLSAPRCQWSRIGYSAFVNAIAETIDQRLRSLPAPQARKLEVFLLQVLDLFGTSETKSDTLQPAQQYTLPTRDLRVRPGLDLTKLAHFDEDGLDA